ncbi:chemotaxis response regulator protein-glutamate methylesterase [Mucilaginibacter robiniae]|uniref:Protein-glutamate methylesterase/protein-glutamine glutaminase n=1 Tax=Mucilaginibacter robiniae TaxID=2728022 RepID=A0A7L5DZI9_9SPHI|nr:chemotaxis response regulator protein-glutamate methylesterase [Mucilaginibacter robiniae]QJD96530.1 chemotaxis response regulator protein-glutamate methylesterase [Mucilaginibacter robiniae]
MVPKIKVLIVDDSAYFRQLLHQLLLTDESFEVIATAADPFIAAHKMERQAPDVILLDSDMPRMSGLTFLRKIMHQHPIPIILMLDATEPETTTNQAKEYGAVAVWEKSHLEHMQLQHKLYFCDAIKTAVQNKLKKSLTADISIVKPKLSADVIIKHTSFFTNLATHNKVIVVGASTGGTEAIRTFLKGLPVNCPGIVVVQHMPEGFTRSFAERLNELCCQQIKEAEEGDQVKPGTVLIAPGNQHILLKRNGSHYFVTLNSGPLVNRHRPSVDVLFRSAAIDAGKNCLGILLTGMGNDGAQGLLEIKQAAGHTIVQDEASSVVFGMPKEAIRLCAAEIILPLKSIASHVSKLYSTTK